MQSKLHVFVKSHTMLTTATSSAGTKQQQGDRACGASGIAHKPGKLSSAPWGGKAWGAEHPPACRKGSARRAGGMSGEIKAQLVTGKGLGAQSQQLNNCQPRAPRAHGPSLLHETPHALISPWGESCFQPRLFVYSANFVA